MKKQTAMHTVDDKSKNYLSESEMKLFLDAARKGRHGARDHVMMLLTFRHGLRVSELVDVRVKDLDLNSARLYVRRIKGSLSTEQPLAGDELRAIKTWQRVRAELAAATSPYLFLSERATRFTRQAIRYLVGETARRANLGFEVNPHMLRHSCGYHLANKGHDTRLIQDWLGHRNISNTVIYTRTAAARFEGLWR